MQTREIQNLTLNGEGYPRLLREIHTPPDLLYVKGTLLEEDAAAVAIVGTRAATPYGLDTARRLAEELAASGITVVSGLAEGIDRAAHEGALKAGGRTIAVVGHGLSMVYPRHHGELAERIAQSGCLLSEFPMDEPPSPWNFPRRNRIISGLSLGVVVVEAPLKSGALITAREAAEQGREVFAVPGPIGRTTEGSHALLRDGAKLVERAADILEELAPHLRGIICSSTDAGRMDTAAIPAGLSEEQQEILKLIPVGTSAGLDRLADRTALAPNRLLSVLTELELKGLVRQQVGQGFTRKR